MAEHRSTVRICCVAFLIWVAAAGSAGADPPTRESWPENAGTASVSQAGSKALAFTFPGYVKAGDALSITFDKEVTRLLQMDVKTWLEKPEEPATLRVTMQSMPNGISFPGSIVLSIPASKLEVRITKSNYQKLAM